ncbi:MAG TPA: type II secretion system protein GspG [Polyangiaceae bacterium]|nr:type II secretion system protein GspG [Polyangiaceae bacterium]
MWGKTDRSWFFPWERRGGLFRQLGLDRLRPLLGAALVLGFLGLLLARERTRAGVRRTHAILLDVRRAIDAYMAEHDGHCPPDFAALGGRMSSRGIPRDAWGNPLTLICPGTEPGEAYELMSAGPDGIAGGLDRIE